MTNSRGVEGVAANPLGWKLRYGDGATLHLDLPTAASVADCTRPRGEVLDDPVAAVQAAVADPLGFPPLKSAIVPGDRIVIALGDGLPRKSELVAGIVQTLLRDIPEVASISVLLPDSGSAMSDGLSDDVRARIDISAHDPEESEALSYLAASREGKPIYFNKKICDADFVVPVTTLRLEQTLGYYGIHGGLFPSFSDSATRERFRAPSAVDWAAHQRRRREEVDEAAWLLGIQFTIQVVPGPGESILQVLAGGNDKVTERGQAIGRSAWQHTAPGPAQLVIAAIEGGPEQQTWENFARALYVATQAVADGGAIVLCTQMRCRPGPSLMRLTSGADDFQMLREIRRDRSADALSATLIVEAKQRARVYLLSDLETDFVEDLGIGHVDGEEDLGRLSIQYDNCMLLGNAQHASVITSP